MFVRAKMEKEESLSEGDDVEDDIDINIKDKEVWMQWKIRYEYLQYYY